MQFTGSETEMDLEAAKDILKPMESAFIRFHMNFAGRSLRKCVREAHLGTSPERYLRTIHANLLWSLVLFAVLAALTGFTPIGDLVFNVIPPAAFWLISFILLVPGLYLFQFFYPSIVAQGRKTRIELDLPYAISYMQALSTTMPPFEVIRKIYEEHDMFGEVSHEFGMVVRDVEVFGDDMITAMRNLQQITPSPYLRDFLNDLAIVFDSGGDMTSYLAAKVQFFRERSHKELELVLKTIEIMAEVYVAAFVAGPIALIIMLVAGGMTGKSMAEWMVPFMFIVIPLGAIVMIWLLSVMLPPENMEISHREILEYDFARGISSREGSAEEMEQYKKRLEEKKKHHRFMNKIRRPFRAFISSYSYGAAAGAFGVVFVLILWISGMLDIIFVKNVFEVYLALSVIAFMAPVAIAYEGRRWYVRNVESNIPEFLRELSDMKDIGLTLQEGILRISNAKLGILSSELSVASRDMAAGANVNSALVRMEERIGLVSVKRAISLLVKASEITTNLREIFMIAITNFEHYLNLKQERSNTTIIYVMIIYLSFGIFLYTAYQLNIPFLAAFQGQNLNIDLSGNVTDMFRLALILGTFSGIMAGQFSSNSALSGFKHSIVLLISAVIMFVFII
jgi:archaeal flagellar protein FlaJ